MLGIRGFCRSAQFIASLSGNGFLRPANGATLLNSEYSQKRLFANGGKPKNYYEILGIQATAKESEVKAAYLKLAKKYHPDVCKEKDASNKFQEVSEAYEVLSDKQKRKEYDAYRSGGGGGFGRQGFDQRGTQQGWNYQSSRSAQDIFDQFFRGGFGGGDFAGSSYGFEASQQVQVKISFEEAARGVQKSINVNAIDTCAFCRGNGCAPGKSKVTCPYCSGTGFQTSTLSGFTLNHTCNYCKGAGKYNKDPCQTCAGTGQTVVNKKIGVYIPAGVDNGEMLRVQVGQSMVYLNIQVNPSLIHRREKENIHTDVEISLADAVLGGQINVPGIESDTVISIPPGTSSHRILCLKGKGIKRLNGIGTGDQFVNIKISVPKTLTQRQRELIEEWKRIEKGEEPKKPPKKEAPKKETETAKETKKEEEKPEDEPKKQQDGVFQRFVNLIRGKTNADTL
ncbi:unnamed protein product [Bursaphelenchus xylophilus]|uniref:(pine wood nematode) hypothetical protein n=1 Tax=Bursaphelenchus xylophilus TaxID=6326 RepID=A0A1I7SVE8_BURXY|nr:unnamed protein product [Bursaphelenchus xylophilus]CAG9101346.1 unnamed protein product [Bursaphelenchus xylophilus]